MGGEEEGDGEEEKVEGEDAEEEQGHWEGQEQVGEEVVWSDHRLGGFFWFE